MDSSALTWTQTDIASDVASFHNVGKKWSFPWEELVFTLHRRSCIGISRAHLTNSFGSIPDETGINIAHVSTSESWAAQRDKFATIHLVDGNTQERYAWLVDEENEIWAWATFNITYDADDTIQPSLDGLKWEYISGGSKIYEATKNTHWWNARDWIDNSLDPIDFIATPVYDRMRGQYLRFINAEANLITCSNIADRTKRFIKTAQIKNGENVYIGLTVEEGSFDIEFYSRADARANTLYGANLVRADVSGYSHIYYNSTNWIKSSGITDQYKTTGSNIDDPWVSVSTSNPVDFTTYVGSDDKFSDQLTLHGVLSGKLSIREGLQYINDSNEPCWVAMPFMASIPADIYQKIGKDTGQCYNSLIVPLPDKADYGVWIFGGDAIDYGNHYISGSDLKRGAKIIKIGEPSTINDRASYSKPYHTIEKLGKEKRVAMEDGTQFDFRYHQKNTAFKAYIIAYKSSGSSPSKARLKITQKDLSTAISVYYYSTEIALSSSSGTKYYFHGIVTATVPDVKGLEVKISYAVEVFYSSTWHSSLDYETIIDPSFEDGKPPWSTSVVPTTNTPDQSGCGGGV